MDLATVDAFLAYHLSKESLVIAILTDVYDMFDRRCGMSGARNIYCTSAFYVWLVLHLFRQESRPTSTRSPLMHRERKAELEATLGQRDRGIH